MTMVLNESGGEVSLAASVESQNSWVSWGAVIAGAVSATAVSLLLTLLGSGLGLSVISPWSINNPSLTTIAASALIWLILVHWIGSAVGGFLAGRLRRGWDDLDRDEVLFRDTTHGFLTWGIAVLLVAALSGVAASAVLFTGVQAASNVASGAAQGAAQSATQNATAGGTTTVTDPNAYFVDVLFRPAPGTTAVTTTALPAGAAASSANADVRGEVGRIFVRDIAMDQFPAEDRAYLGDVVVARTGLPPDAAKMRVDSVIASLQDAKAKAKDAADKARKAAATASFGLVLALLVGAFIACVAAAFGGHLRDEPST
jgi:hypothetical protein